MQSQVTLEFEDWLMRWVVVPFTKIQNNWDGSTFGYLVWDVMFMALKAWNSWANWEHLDLCSGHLTRLNMYKEKRPENEGNYIWGRISQTGCEYEAMERNWGGRLKNQQLSTEDKSRIYAGFFFVLHYLLLCMDSSLQLNPRLFKNRTGRLER